MNDISKFIGAAIAVKIQRLTDAMRHYHAQRIDSISTSDMSDDALERAILKENIDYRMVIHALRLIRDYVGATDDE